MWLVRRHFLCLYPLVNQGHARTVCILSSLQAALGLPEPFHPMSHQCWRAFAPAYTEKMSRLEQYAAQDTYCLAEYAYEARRLGKKPPHGRLVRRRRWGSTGVPVGIEIPGVPNDDRQPGPDSRN